MQNYINVRGELLDLSKPKVMGIVNVTPDSFFADSRVEDVDNVVDRVGCLLDDGASIIDIGGCSTRPDGQPASREEEENRLFPLLSVVRKNFPDAILSIDTFRSAIAKKAVEQQGVDIINDISGGELDELMKDVIVELNVPYIMTHWQEESSGLRGEEFIADVIRWFARRVTFLKSNGVKDVIIDPGFGFGKSLEQNFDLMKGLADLSILELPLLVGVSRKSMIYKTLDITSREALNGTTVLNTVALLKGANILRVHDVKEAVEAVRLIEGVF